MPIKTHGTTKNYDDYPDDEAPRPFRGSSYISKPVITSVAEICTNTLASYGKCLGCVGDVIEYTKQSISREIAAKLCQYITFDEVADPVTGNIRIVGKLDLGSINRP